MTDQKSYNCIVCAQEFNPSEINNLRLSKINNTNFKVCTKCIVSSDPSDDYKQVKDIINSYFKFSSHHLYDEVKHILSNKDSK